ncbi:Two-component sensor histidine kinase [Georgfuchsia toluolica]|uniref:histidine kinase n=1 Tax=Georgfuchsia toluolica TaxID=424218 RepID=A0A916J1P9_9PROT|nr:sensor histidine kinase [Georgfuchsia toluolica]CAG4882372.1 Two-component sensor histidine kinase [Georgfuchsia toluolica]
MNFALLRNSLRIRLLAGTLFWIITSVLVAGWGLGQLFHQHIEAQFEAELKNHLDQLTAQLILDDQNQAQIRLPPSDPRLNKPLSGLYWQIDRIAAAGEHPVKAVLRSRSLWDESLAVPADAPADGEIHQHRIDGPEGVALRVAERAVTIDMHSFKLMVAANESLMTEPIADFKDHLWLALGILGMGLTFAASMQVFVGLAPLRSMQDALGRVRRGDARQMEGTFPNEILPLVNEFNSVLVQNAEVVERARTQAGNLAHALKTPLSVLANAANASERRDDELARLVTSQVDAVRKQVDYHLSRAQAAASVQVPGMRTTVEPVIQGLVRVMQCVHADRWLDFVVLSDQANLAFRGEEQDLQEMLGNLIDNASKWARSRIEIRVKEESGKLRISVDDDGNGIAEAERDSVIKRGVRADEQVPGTGLGLAITADLARMYGGDLLLAKSSLGGLQASLILPAA